MNPLINQTHVPVNEQQQKQNQIDFAFALFSPLLKVLHTHNQIATMAERFHVAIQSISKKIDKEKLTNPLKNFKVKTVSKERLEASAKAKKFVICYIENRFNLKNTMLAMGYNIKTAEAQGVKMLQSAIVQDTLEEILYKSKSSAIATLEELLQVSTSIMRDPEEKSTDRLKAIDTISKVAGISTDEERAKQVGVISVNISQTVPRIEIVD